MDDPCTHPLLGRLGVKALHRGLSRAAREACLGGFRNGRTKVDETSVIVSTLISKESLAVGCCGK